MSQTENPDEFVTVDLFKSQYKELGDRYDDKLLLICMQANRDLTGDLSSAVNLTSLTGTPHFQFAQGVAFLKAEEYYHKRILKNNKDADHSEKQYSKAFDKLVSRLRNKTSPRKFSSTNYEETLVNHSSHDFYFDD